MSIAISSASAGAAHRFPDAPAARPAPAAAVSASAATASSAQETSALNHALTTYRSDLQQGQAASSLTGLARQIAADAKVLGQRVTLPTAAPPAEAAPAPANAPAASPVNVFA